MNNSLAEFVKGVLTDDEIITEKVKEQIKKALAINCHLTSCYALKVEEVIDILGKSPRDSGWYIILSGTRCGFRFFLNNDMKITRKPNKNNVRIVARYSLYNNNTFSENFWINNF